MIFLTAEWRNLAMLNYEVPPELLRPFVPRGTELDSFAGKTYVSMVGFHFLNTRVAGFAIPFHRTFEEVNLRFYVRRNSGDGVRRGVVFIKEIVPRRVIATVARIFYNENYVTMAMRHLPVSNSTEVDAGLSIEYAWRFRCTWNRLGARIAGTCALAAPGSEAEFITEHYWGYSRQPDGGCVEYQVEHPRWRIWPVHDPLLECDAAGLYGPELAECLKKLPTSAFLAEGSAVIVRKGVRI